jgi:hypothetical protein
MISSGRTDDGPVPLGVMLPASLPCMQILLRWHDMIRVGATDVFPFYFCWLRRIGAAGGSNRRVVKDSSGRRLSGRHGALSKGDTVIQSRTTDDRGGFVFEGVIR